MKSSPASTLKRKGWVCEEAGWWTHEQRGGIAIERDGKWWAHSASGEKPLGPFKTALKAARALK